jgi:myo-inositol-1(or 4)-monophosphatase
MLACATQAAQAGSEILRECFGTKVDIHSKGIANFVTQADLSAEQAIVDAIRSAHPDHAIISEESHSDRADASDLWIIDPLDGTSNFMHGIPHFAVSIAYYHNGQPEVGIVANPITGDWYVAVRDQGAWHNDVRQHVATASRLDETLIVCGFYYDRGKMMQATLNTLGDFFRNNIHGMRRFGAAALDLCNVGCGQYGLFFEYKLHPWDYAAGQLFLCEAGGKATDCNNLKLPIYKPSSICATNTLLHDQAIAVIRPHWNTLDNSQ